MNTRYSLTISLAAGIISGIALFFSFFYLKESNKDVIAVNEIKEKAKKATEGIHNNEV